PCNDKDVYFQCPNDYPNACLHRSLKCDKTVQCPSGDDERTCGPRHSPGVSFVVIILGILAVVFIMCTTSIEGDIPEDVGLMKGDSVIVDIVQPVQTPPQYPQPVLFPVHPVEPVVGVHHIDSTKPVYPKLE
ncbi:unnamed protein product, partial [Didymodactylos carnosus]